MTSPSIGFLKWRWWLLIIFKVIVWNKASCCMSILSLPLPKMSHVTLIFCHVTVFSHLPVKNSGCGTVTRHMNLQEIWLFHIRMKNAPICLWIKYIYIRDWLGVVFPHVKCTHPTRGNNWKANAAGYATLEFFSVNRRTHRFQTSRFDTL